MDRADQTTRARRATRWGVVALAAATALAAAAPAHAGYSVTTTANTGRGYNRGCAATYNVIGAGAAFVVNDGSNAHCDPAGFLSSQGATVTVSGSTDTTGKLTAAHDESSVVRLPDTAYATAAADLKTGKVKLTASSANFAGANASAGLSDTLHFTVAGATATTVSYVPVSFSFGGALSPGADPTHSSATLYWSFAFGGGYAYEFGDYGAGYYSPPSYPTFAFPEVTPGRVGGWQSYSFASYTPTDTRFTGVYAITGASADVNVNFGLGLIANGVALDFSKGGSIGVGKVAGVSYTSDSGVFLTGGATVGGVPEPASWALMLGGFGLVGGVARRRRVTVAA